MLRLMTVVLALSGCNTLKGPFVGLADGLRQDFNGEEERVENGEPMHEPHCQVQQRLEMKYPPVVLTYEQQKLHREIEKLRKKVMKKFAGVPMHWFDFTYSVSPEQDGKVTMNVTACLKETYRQQFEGEREKLYKMLEEGA